MSRDSDHYRPYRSERRSAFKWAIWIILALFGLGGLTYVLSTGFKILSAPSRVVNRTLDTSNIIHNYEWFHDTNEAFGARLSQVKSHSKAMAGAKADGADSTTLDRYRVELEGMRQSCRDLAARYNANSTKTNRSIFKGREAPETLDAALCDA